MRLAMKTLGKVGCSALCAGALALSLTSVVATPAHAVDAMSVEGQVTTTTWNRNPAYGDFFGVDTVNDNWGVEIDPNKDGSGLTVDNITNNPQSNSSGALRYLFMGSPEYNVNPNPYYYNLIYQTDGPKLLRGSAYGYGPTGAPGVTDATALLWDLRPNIMAGGAASIEKNVTAWKEAHPDFADYNPIAVNVDQSDTSTMIATNYTMAEAADKVVADSNGKLTLRYGSAVNAAKQYERIARGSQGYILSQLKRTGASKKTVALVSKCDGTTVTLQTSFGNSSTTGDALSNVAVCLGADGLAGATPVEGKAQATMSMEDFKKAAANVALIVVDGNDDTSYAVPGNPIAGLESLYSKLYWVTDSDCGAVNPTKGGCLDYAQHYVRLLGCLYPEYMSQSSDVAYYYDTMYHLKSDALSKAVDKAMDGVRNWDVKTGSNAAAYLEWTPSTMASYKKADVEAQLTYGLAYLKSLGTSAPEDLQLTSTLAAEVPNIATLKDPGATATPETPAKPATPSGKWNHNSKGWWWTYSDGTYAKGWETIDGKWYYFDNAGWMQTGWQKISGKWYYLGAANDGAMKTGWQKVSGSWYYLGAANDGAMKTGWQKVDGEWYYLKSSGAMATGWQKVSGSWYYLQSSGAMKTGWLQDGGNWYYLQSSGAMATGWYKVANTWYYSYSSGVMASNTRVDGYWLNASGAWVPGA